MTCRCAKITKCRSDIAKISNAKDAIKVLRNNDAMVDLRLLELSGSMQEMATPGNMDSCAEAIKKMNSCSATAIDSMINQCTQRISALQSDLSAYEREDQLYHQVQKE